MKIANYEILSDWYRSFLATGYQRIKRLLSSLQVLACVLFCLPWLGLSCMSCVRFENPLLCLLIGKLRWPQSFLDLQKCEVGARKFVFKRKPHTTECLETTH